MKPSILIGAVICALISAIPLAAREPEASRIDPKADAILRKMGQTLAAATNMSVESHAINDELRPDGVKLQYARTAKISVRKPDKLAGDVTGDIESFQFRYDGKEVVLFNPRKNSWGATAAPSAIPDTLDMLAEKHGMMVPLADFLFPDPYKCLTENVRMGEYVGTGYVFETKCHHLAFRQASVDWQIWIEDSVTPLPRKIVITFKESPAHPQYTAFLSNWNLSANTPDSAFIFTPPADAKKVEFAPATQPAPTGR